MDGNGYPEPPQVWSWLCVVQAETAAQSIICCHLLISRLCACCTAAPDAAWLIIVDVLCSSTQGDDHRDREYRERDRDRDRWGAQQNENSVICVG
jgi:hypothetical protein